MVLYIANWGLVLALWLWQLGDDTISPFPLVLARPQKMPDEDNISGVSLVLLLAVFYPYK